MYTKILTADIFLVDQKNLKNDAFGFEMTHKISQSKSPELSKNLP